MFYVHQEIELVVTGFSIPLKPQETQLENDEISINSFHNRKICPEYLEYSKNDTNKYPVIDVYYGPYECNRMIKYRPQKLDGFIKYLENMSYNVKLIPFGYLNTVEIVCMGHLIHKFDIRYLKFNTPYEDDLICCNAVGIINEAIDRLYGEKNIIKKHDKKLNKHVYNRRGTTISVSSQVSLSEYDTFLESNDMYF